MAMSKEEKAVRDALAKFERDFAASTAVINAINQGSTSTVSVPKSSPYNTTGPFNPMGGVGRGEYGPSVSTVSTGPVSPTTATGPTTTSTATLPTTQQQSNVISGERRDAFQAIINALAPYNLEGLAGTVEQLMKDPNVGPSTAVYKLKFDTSINPSTGKPWNIAYQTRFPANVERINAGKPALSEAEYLSAERTYSQVLTSYGVGNLATKANFNKFISGDVSATEVADRVATAIDRVQNASAATKDALAQYYPKLNQLDIVTAVLDPTIGVPELKRKIQLAEIGGAATALGAGMTPEERNRMILSEARAGELAAAGVTGEQARRGYEAIGGFLQRGSQLADIYKQQAYTQQTAEQEIFGLQDSVMASQRRKKLTELETAQFGGKSGLTGGALQRDRAGQF